MNIAFLLHFYQPHDQQDDILKRIVNESYRPLTEGFLNNAKAKVIVNINGSLTNLLLEKGYSDVIDNLKNLAERGQIEFTGSGMYHAFFPLIPEQEIQRQIDLNNETNIRVFGNAYKPTGFFVPEMALNEKVIKMVSKNNFQWLAVAEIAKQEGQVLSDRIYEHAKYPINLFFRNKRVSSYVLSATVRDPEAFIHDTKDLQEKDKYWFCAMDAETFGHHRIGHEKFLLEVLNHKFFTPVLGKDLLALGLPTEKTLTRDCTWTNSEQDFHMKGEVNSFVLWRDLGNPIHKLQWEFLDYILQLLEENKNSPNYMQARLAMDKAVASDQFWWASGKPWWSLEMIESGAFALKGVAKILNAHELSLQKAEEYYRKILDIAFEWQRSGYIRKINVDNSGTYLKKSFKERAPAEWFNQMLLEFEAEMNKSASTQDFEKAVKWRDAILKIQQETDVYDILHVVDELWLVRSIPSVKPFLEHDWGEFSDFVKDKFREVTSKEEFEAWKKRKNLQ